MRPIEQLYKVGQSSDFTQWVWNAPNINSLCEIKLVAESGSNEVKSSTPSAKFHTRNKQASQGRITALA